MLEIYWSEDRGLLENFWEKEKLKYKNPLVLKMADAELLKKSLTSQNVLEEDDCIFQEYDIYLVWDFDGSSEEIKDLFSLVDQEKISIIFLSCSKEEPLFSRKLDNFFSKKEKFSRLNEKKKEGYILKKLSDFKLSEKTKAYLKKNLPNQATIINEFFRTLELYSDEKEITLSEAKSILNFCYLEKESFSFLKKYLTGDSDWIKIFNENSIEDNKFSSFFMTFSYKLFEFKNFLLLRNKNLSFAEISKSMEKEEYFLKEYENLFSALDKKKENWINKFLINLASLVGLTLSSRPYKIYMFKYFLLKNSL